MDGLSAFVDAIYEYEIKERSIRDYEEDQILPPKGIVEEVCQVLLNISSMREEGKISFFQSLFCKTGFRTSQGIYIFARSSI